MKFAIVRPREKKIEVVDVPDANDAKALAGLNRDKTDIGTLYQGLAYICDEYAMFVHPQFYFAVGRVLIAGNVVLYAFDQSGASVDYDVPPHRWGGRFIGDEAAAEAAIKAGQIDRPQMAADGKVFWQWPAPMPDMKAWANKLAAAMARGPVQLDDITIIPMKKDE